MRREVGCVNPVGQDFRVIALAVVVRGFRTVRIRGMIVALRIPVIVLLNFAGLVSMASFLSCRQLPNTAADYGRDRENKKRNEEGNYFLIRIAKHHPHYRQKGPPLQVKIHAQIYPQKVAQKLETVSWSDRRLVATSEIYGGVVLAGDGASEEDD